MVLIVIAFFAHLETTDYRQEVDAIDRKLTEMLESGSILLADATHRRDSEQVLLILAPILGDPDIKGIRVTRADGELLAEHGETILGYDDALLRRHPITHIVDGRPAQIATILVGVSHERINAAFNKRLERHIVLAALILAAVAFAIHQSLRLMVMRPMRRLLKSIQSWQVDGTHETVAWSRNDEFGQLIGAFNRMQHQQQFYHHSLRIARDNAQAADRAKTAFLAIISHELRTPLNAIIGFSDLLRRPSGGTTLLPTEAEYVDHIGDSGRHLLALVNDILDVTHAHAKELNLAEENVAIDTLFQHAISAASGGVERETAPIDLRIEKGLETIWCDAPRLGRAIEHLLANALAATPAGGEVSLSAQREDGDLVFRIRDNGEGIPEEKLASIMQPFSTGDGDWRNHSEGAGLGLTYAGVMVQLHGGSFDISSAPLAGTTATLRLPADRLNAS